MKRANRPVLWIHSVAAAAVCFVFVTEAHPNPVVATQLVANDFQATSSSQIETTPTLGSDNGAAVLVYTSIDLTTFSSRVFYQLLTDTAPLGAAVAVGDGTTNDNLNDVSGNWIVYTATQPSNPGIRQIRRYRISDGFDQGVSGFGVMGEARIHGANVAWIEGTRLYLDDAPFGSRIRIAGSVPAASQVEIGDTFVVWHESGDIWAYDLRDGTKGLAATAGNNPSTSGSWVVWESAGIIQGANLDTGQTVALGDALDVNANPSIDGNNITWESNASGNFDIYIHRLAEGDTFQVTTDLADQQLDSLHGNQVAYLDNRNGLDIHVSTFSFVPNQRPVADAGPDQNAFVGGSVTLLGSATDSDGDAIVSWSWTVVSSPVGSSASVFPDFSPTPGFIGDLPGDYVLSLEVSDGTDTSLPATVTVHLALNLPPVAVLAADVVSGFAPLTVNFDGTGSFDPEGGPLDFDWSFGDASLSETTAVAAHTYSVPGSFVVVLEVVDDQQQIAAESILITVASPINNPPDVSPSAVPNTGSAPLTVQFMAGASDADGDPLFFDWDFDDPTSADNLSTLADPVHTYAIAGTYVAQLTVSDSVDTVNASMTVVVESPTLPSLGLSVKSVKLKFKKDDRADSKLRLKACFTPTVPGPDDIIAVSFDGVELFSVPFSEFVLAGEDDEDDDSDEDGEDDDHNPTKFKLKARNLKVELDIGKGRLEVSLKKFALIGLDETNGVDVELHIGAMTGIDTVALSGKKRQLEFKEHDED